MLHNRGIAFKLIFFFTICGGLVFLLVFGFNYRFSRALIRKNTEEQARILALSKVNRIEATLLAIQKVPESLAYFLENGSYDQAELTWVLRALVQNNPEIYGAAVAFEPYEFDDHMLYFAPYFYKKGNEIAFIDLGRESYQYLQADWYQIPKALNRPDWSEPYYDECGGNILMTTYSVPFYKKEGDKKRLLGIVTADVNLTWLQEVVSSIKVLRSGYGFLISKNGTIVTHPIKELIMNETLFGAAEERNDPGLRAIGRKMIRGESGFVPFKSLTTQQSGWIHYTPVPASGWSLAVFFPQNELFADIGRLNRIVIGLGLIGLFLLALSVAVIARSITRPLRAMAQATKQIALGNLDTELPPQKSEDEVGRLSAAFFFMKESLKEYIDQLTVATASRERMQSELQIARDIQMNILPNVFPPFPHRMEFDIWAAIEPAKEVGGDFYDFFLIDEGKICFTIGDVSGKGVPAALFMAVTKTLIKAVALQGAMPGEILTRVNRELAQGNEACMFVTIFCGILDLKTGMLRYANGGHNDPLLLRSGEPVFPLKGPRGLVVGAMDDLTYATGESTMLPGDRLYLYTDGVTEAMNAQQALFTEERLHNSLERLKNLSIQEMINALMKELEAFAENVSQSDDITMLLVQFNNKIVS